MSLHLSEHFNSADVKKYREDNYVSFMEAKRALTKTALRAEINRFREGS